ncbi:hypothetical protein JXA84_07160 [candidate division WOR-3 bacterium]|nr:hypothetical protein [candidate division WOR-3 bacterium]
MKLIYSKFWIHMMIASVSFPLTFFKCVLNLKKGQESSGEENREHRGRFYEITSTDSWKRFRKAWREMDEVARYGFSDDSGLLQEFKYIDLREPSDSLRASLISLKDLQENSLISGFEMELLSDMAESKIQYMSGFNHLTRSIPPLIEIKMDDRIKRINMMIVELEELKRSELITDEQLDSALENIVRNLNEFARMQIAHEYLKSWGWDAKYGYNPSLENNDNIDIEVVIQATMSRLDSIREDGRMTEDEYMDYVEIYNKTLADLAVFDSIAPFMDSLFRDLCTEE